LKQVIFAVRQDLTFCCVLALSYRHWLRFKSCSLLCRGDW